MDFLNGSFRIGRLFGINIRIHMLFLLWIAFRLSNSQGDLKYALAFLGMLFGIVLIHEFGHCFGARSVGGDAEEILLWPLGGLAFAHAPMRPWPQFVTVICGPLVNVVFCLLSGAAIAVICGGIEHVPFGIRLRFPPISAEWQLWLVLFYHINFYLLLFNMLPIYPMDGGQLLWTLLWPFLGLRRATLAATQIGLGGAVLLGAWGLRDHNYMLVAIAVMGGLTCFQRMMMARSGFMAEELLSVEPVLSDKRRTGLWSRLFRRRPKFSIDVASGNPNPGGWESKMTTEDALEAQVDEILEKVHRHGIQSLSYVERQTLERVTRLRRERDTGFPGSLNP